ncbi:MAG: uL15 family ribosomal protein [Patescibacteria group bacterium]|nr:uL15 family ribosomal protein [Patescibacteria group bacterium]MDE2116683.1 uL15 family ribosomal protein [Patescibacteria group bacterium]
MQLNNLQRKTPNRRSISIGRGGKRGKTSGRGTKGQDSRAGHKKRPEIRDMIKKLPKLRGYAFKSFAPRAIVVPLSAIEKAFKAGDRVEPATLVAKGVVSKTEGKFPRIKILGGKAGAETAITKKLVVSGVEVSASAKAALEKAGGTVHA